MSDKREPEENGHDEEIPSVEQVAHLDAFLDQIVDDRQPAAKSLTGQELTDQMLAAQLRLSREGVEAPSPAFLQALEQKVGQAVDQERRRRQPRLSRSGFLRTAATIAGGVGLGVAGIEGAAVIQEKQRPHDLVEADNARWYDIAAVDEVPAGGVKPFSAGGVLGFLLNTDGRLHAVSAICTHMGCRLKPSRPGQEPVELRCLCHGSRFNQQGDVLQGLAPSPLPAVAVRVENGRVLAQGTRETV